MAVTYCNTTTDLTKAYFDIERYHGHFLLDSTKWVQVAGNVYKYENIGYFSTIFENGEPVDVVSSLDSIDVKEWWQYPKTSAGTGDATGDRADSGEVNDTTWINRGKTGYANPTHAVESGTVQTGSYSIKFISDSELKARWLNDISDENFDSIPTSRWFEYDFYIYNDSAAEYLEICLAWADDTSADFSGDIRRHYLGTTGSWVQISGRIKSGTGDERVLGIDINFNNSSNSVYIDNVSIKLSAQYYYDSTNDTLYYYSSDAANPNTHTIEIGETWGTFKTTCRNIAQGKAEGFLGTVMPVPFPKVTPPKTEYNSALYDPIIVEIVAKLTCYEIISRLNPNDPIGIKLYKDCYNPEPEFAAQVGEKKGLINQILDGELVIKGMRSNREPGSYNIYEYDSNADDIYFEVTGKYLGSEYAIWRLEIDGAGAPGTATYKLSRDGGTNWDETGKETTLADGDTKRISIGSGIFVRFYGTFTQGEYIDIELFPITDKPNTSKVTTIRMSR